MSYTVNLPGQTELHEQETIMRIIRNLYYYLDCTTSGYRLQSKNSSTERENTICQLITVKREISSLSPELRSTISLIGLQGLDEWETSARLGITRRAVNKRLWRAVELIHNASLQRSQRAG